MGRHLVTFVVSSAAVLFIISSPWPRTAVTAEKQTELCMHRHEDRDLMNKVPLRIFAKSGQDAAIKVAQLTGGQEACVPIKVGPLQVEASGRWPYETEGREPQVCKSNVLRLKMERGQRLDIWFSPRGEGATYSCGWDVSTVDPAKK